MPPRGAEPPCVRRVDTAPIGSSRNRHSARDNPRWSSSIARHWAVLSAREDPSSEVLVLFADRLRIALAIWIEKFLATFLPRRFELRRCDIPIRSAVHANRSQVLAQLLHGRPTEEPIPIVDLVNDKTGLQHDCVRDHRIVNSVGIFDDIE